ncbi:hypothetical protein NHX12_030221 [Muraenolepis orangiensis]|uniref:Uncharacterized protein n=1 Tax=Muraenolepis orangiensis TaxID=630683 RepID=A0A9Q0E932_9TELE|nr:hypothetical protein NHX12_030221 [Muraenolepis orangiensis]
MRNNATLHLCGNTEWSGGSRSPREEAQRGPGSERTGPSEEPQRGGPERSGPREERPQRGAPERTGPREEPQRGPGPEMAIVSNINNCLKAVLIIRTFIIHISLPATDLGVILIF